MTLVHAFEESISIARPIQARRLELSIKAAEIETNDRFRLLARLASRVRGFCGPAPARR